MSRKIKVRLYSKPAKKYIDYITVGFLNTGELRSYSTENGFGPVLEDNYIVEQHTGLKDKNGKEIYEGDIVKTTDRVTVKDLIFPIGVVEFKQQAFWICNVPSERPDFTHNETLLKYWETDLEVIGNIHESNMEDK